MPEGGQRPGRDVVLGLNAAWGFAPADQSSPVLAGAAGALIDVAMTGQPVTELRIHGVSGSNGPTMLEHPGGAAGRWRQCDRFLPAVEPGR